MNLLTKTSLYFMTIALFILFFGGIGFYFLLKALVYKEVNRDLTIEMHKLVYKIRHEKTLKNNNSSLVLPEGYLLQPIDNIKIPTFTYKDTILLDNFENKYQSYRVLTYQTELDGNPYQISIFKSLSITDELIERVTIAIFFLTLLFLLGTYIINRFSLSQIWKDFFVTTNFIKSYNIAENKIITLPESEISEFTILNKVVEKMTERIRQDYLNLKEFSENVSHEIQTPLAIIKTKVDLLMQGENLDEIQLNQIASIQNSINRLSNLNKSLILLTKIDNNQFISTANVELNQVLDALLENFKDFIEVKNLSVNKNYLESITLKADFNLINILFLNLLKNAINYNINNGILDISLDKKSVTIGNSGKEPTVDTLELFNRFSKSSRHSDSLGLGLAIVKKICEIYQFQISYDYQNNYHKIIISDLK
jgi:signal transduction histidine kinase